MAGALGAPPVLAAGAVALDELGRRPPPNQLVTFNKGCVAPYRRDADAAREAFERTASPGPGTRLGRTASLLARLRAGGVDPGP